jgi:hypothetical protein
MIVQTRRILITSTAKIVKEDQNSQVAKNDVPREKDLERTHRV